MAFDLDDGDGTDDRTPTEICIEVRYCKQENAVYFDSLQLIKDIADSYTYDSDGNLITSKENGENSSAFTYKSRGHYIIPSSLVKMRNGRSDPVMYTMKRVVGFLHRPM